MSSTLATKACLRAIMLAVLAALLGAANASADVDDDAAESEWSAYVPATTPGAVIAPTTPEGGFSSSDRTLFDEQLRSKVLDQLCRYVKLNKEFDFGTGDFSGTSVGISRYLATNTDNKLSVVDEERVRAVWGHGFGKDFDGVPGGLRDGLFLGGSIDGRSMVIRPTDQVNTCSELGPLANVMDIKTVFPFSADRISKMMVGELWRIPFVLSYSQGLSLSDVLSDRASASISFGRSEAGMASMTLYRLSEDKTRFRFRIDHVVITSRALGISQTFPIIAFATDATNILARVVEKEFARQLERYIAAWLNIGSARSDGKRVMVEFVVDARDPEQALALSRALKGDLKDLVRMGLKMSTLQVTDDSAREAYDRLRTEHPVGLGEPTFAAIEEYSADPRSFSLNIPFLIQLNISSLLGSDKVTRLNGATGEFRYYRADKSHSNEMFNAPWVGPLLKNNQQRNAEVVTFAAPGEKHGEPFIVYSHNEGYLRQTASTVRRSMEDVNKILTLAGAQRGANAGRLAIPRASLPPAPPPPEPWAEGIQTESGDYKGYFAMTMVINPKAVREALGASAEQVLKAFAAIVPADDRETTDWLLANSRFVNGKLEYDREAARRRFAPTWLDPDRYDRRRDLSSFSREIAALVADITTARDAKSNEERAEAVATLMAGRGKSDLTHEQVLAVLIQFIDPLDLTGDFVSTINSTARHGKSYGAHYMLKKDRVEVPLLKEAGETKGRFAEPSILQD